MSSFMDMLTGSRSVDLKKCGDVVVSPSDNMVAVYCHFCRDIFTNLREFLRHLQWAHVDVLHFTKEQNGYCVEELLSEEEDAQSAGSRNTSGGDSGVQAESEELEGIKNAGNKAHSSQKTLGLKDKVEDIVAKEGHSQQKDIIESKPENQGFKGPRNKTANEGKTLKICELKSHSIARNSRKRMSSVKNRILQAIENDVNTKILMKPTGTNCSLLITEPLEEGNIQPLNFNTPIKPAPSSSNLSVRKSSLTKARMETDPSQVSHLNSKAKPNSTSQQVKVYSVSSMVKEICQFSKPSRPSVERAKRISSPLQIRHVDFLPKLDLKPKSLTKTSEAIESKESHLPNKKPTSDSLVKPLQTKNPLLKRGLEEIGSTRDDNQPKNLSLSVPNLNTNSNKEQKLSDNDNKKQTKPSRPSDERTKRISSPLQIRHVDFLPKLDLKLKSLTKASEAIECKESPLSNKKPTSDSLLKPLQTKNPLLKRATEEIGSPQDDNEPKNLSVPNLNTNSNKEQKLSGNDNKKHFKLETKNSDNLDLESNNLETSTSKGSKIDQTKINLVKKKQTTNQTIYQKLFKGNTKYDKLEPESIDTGRKMLQAKKQKENLIGIKNEQTSNNTNLRSNKKSGPLLDNATLLKNVGLPAIQNASFEDKIMLDELVQLREKAAQFSKIYMKHDSIWNYRTKTPSATSEYLSLLISALTSEVNLVMGCNMTESELKRIINLISAWYQNMINLKIFKKVALSLTDQHHLNLFAFLPVSAAYFCESCEKIFAFEDSYKKHLVSHEVGYRCTLCNRIFKYQGFYENHLRTVHS
ncbi:protein teflon isoform X1 [Drosophila rhopaloa]|uniref:Protein teflon isoform X1 n=1 Tax=Drosophila rhopaloa TaxID=1041015 RepID=A0A6P4FMM8_DRORH|nr:protein teflon isoform X1 [Drosophila rhopaloa]